MPVSAPSYQLARMPKGRASAKDRDRRPRISGSHRGLPRPRPDQTVVWAGRRRSGVAAQFSSSSSSRWGRRVAQHVTLQIGSRNMTSVSSSNPARVRVLQAGLRDHRSGVSGHRVQV